MRLPEPMAWLMVYPGGRSQLRYARDSGKYFLKDASDLKSYSLYTADQMREAVEAMREACLKEIEDVRDNTRYDARCAIKTMEIEK